MVSTPDAPDPVATAEAQGASNRETAITQAQLNMVNQNNPWGSVNYNQTGTRTYTDADGNTVTTPTYTQTTTLSPSQQRIFNQTQQAQGNLAGLANDQSAFLRRYLGNQIDLSGLPQLQSQFGRGYDATFDGNLGLLTSYAGAKDFSADRRRVEDALWQRTARDRGQADASLRATLAAKGVREGSAAWDAEMQRMAAQNTDARLATIAAGGAEQQRMVNMAQQAAAFGNQARLAQGQFGLGAQQAQNAALAQQAGFTNQARAQGMQEAFAQRNQPINEITALLSGTQVSAPGQMSPATPQTGVAGVDVAGIHNNAYQQQLAASQGAMGGLFGLGGSLLGAAGNAGGFGSLFAFSDARLKTDVQRVGTTPGGVPVYEYRYIWGGPVQVGVMAQDVPHAAVMHESGFLMVDYSRIQ